MFKNTPIPTTTTEQPVEGEGEGGAATPERHVPMYRLRKRIDDMELQLRYPRLNRTWRRRIGMPALADPRNHPGEDGKVRSAPRGKPKTKPQQ